MPIVKFNTEDEFCEEMEKEAARIDRKIVRLTNLFRSSSISPNIRHVLVVATYSVGGQVVRLERYCGNVWGTSDEQDNQVLEKSGKVQLAVQAAADRLILEVRSGVLEEG